MRYIRRNEADERVNVGSKDVKPDCEFRRTKKKEVVDRIFASRANVAEWAREFRGDPRVKNRATGNSIMEETIPYGAGL